MLYRGIETRLVARRSYLLYDVKLRRNHQRDRSMFIDSYDLKQAVMSLQGCARHTALMDVSSFVPALLKIHEKTLYQ